MSERKNKTRYKNISWDYTTLKKIQAEIDALIQEFGEEAKLEISEGYGGYFDMTVSYSTPETDEELKERLHQEDVALQYRRLQYAKLKKEFEG